MRKALYIALAALIAVLSGGAFMQNKNEDKKGPKITFEKDTITVKITDGDDVLLKDVKASDDKDGDVTKSLTVDSLSDFAKDGTRTITYAAFDSSNNVTKASRKISYTDYRSPEFTLKSSPVFGSADTNINIAEILRATDVFDGDITAFIKLKEDNITVGQAGIYYALVTVYNSAGDCSTLKLPVFIESNMINGSAPAINLNSYLIYADKDGKKPDWKKYIASVQDHANRSETKKDKKTLAKVSIDDSNVKMSEEGCYYVNYEYTNEEKNTVVTRLIVAVK